MITMNNQGCYKGFVWMAAMITAAYDSRELHIRLGKALGYASAYYPQKISVEELDRYYELVNEIAKQQEIKIVKRQYSGSHW